MAIRTQQATQRGTWHSRQPLGERNGQMFHHIVADVHWNTMRGTCGTWTSQRWLRCLCQVMPDAGSDEADLSLSGMKSVADDPGVLHCCPQKPAKDAPPILLLTDRDMVRSDVLVHAVRTAHGAVVLLYYVWLSYLDLLLLSLRPYLNLGQWSEEMIVDATVTTLVSFHLTTPSTLAHLVLP